MGPSLRLLVISAATACWLFCHPLRAGQRRGAQRDQRVAFVGLHGGIFEVLKRYEGELKLQLHYVRDEQVAQEKVDFAAYRIVLLQHVRREDRDHWRRLIQAAKKRRPELRFVSISGLAEGRLPELAKDGTIEHDPKLRQYYGSSEENLRRMLIYVSVKYLGRSEKILPPAPVEQQDGLFHPDHEGLFETVGEFLRWARAKGLPVEKVPRAVIAVHSTHLFFQQPKVVEALVRALEKRGVLAVAMIDYGRGYQSHVLEFKPQVVIHTCHSREPIEFRRKVGCPHMHSIFFRKQSIDEWRKSVLGIAPNEMAFQVVGQELLGAIEPQIGAGTVHGGGSPEAFTPIPDRIEHLADRAVAWIRLNRAPNHEKRIAFVYYDREMGKAELMRGSATGMFLNGPRSLARVLKRMKQEGYRLSRLPADEDELVGWMMDHGRQIGVWAPGVLDRLARSGKAVLVPVETYRQWFEAKVPEKQRRELVKRWGEPP